MKAAFNTDKPAIPPEPPDMVICPECDGDGYTITSCCGDDMKPHVPESDLCPSCREHCGGEDDKEECDLCHGAGEIEPVKERQDY